MELLLIAACIAMAISTISLAVPAPLFVKETHYGDTCDSGIG